MWCLVSQANSMVLEIKVDPKAIGQECLEKVCDFLGIGPEADYFGLRLPACAADGGAVDTGLQEDGAHAVAPADGAWANLRNPLHAAHRRRLALRVKFWVPPHRLLLESTRHHFYLHARLDLVEGRMVVADWNVASRLVALIAQAEVGDYDHHYPPNCLYTQCHHIGPQEEKPIDYMQRIVDYHCEIAGMRAPTAEYQLLKEISNLESFGEELFFCKPPSPSNKNNAHNLYSHLLYHRPGEEAEGRLGRGGRGDSMYASQTVGCLTAVGGHEEPAEGCGCKLGMCVGVGPRGIMVYRPGNGVDVQENEKQSIPYTAIIRAAPSRRTFQLHYMTASGSEAVLNIKMATSRLAAALYRAVTEKHAFYCCETVRSDVTKQFIRDLKGTIVSIFNEDSTLGKKYVFDIRRTYTEVYDNARRALFSAATANGTAGTCAVIPHPKNPHCGADCKDSRERSNSQTMEPLACRVCMDQTMDSLFLPCRHVLCCVECAGRCTRCPLCRGEITETLRIYLPVEFTQRAAT